jgi:hypothetical protein
VRATAPLDVDLEDRLLYGLTPTRLAYMVLALLGGFALWSSQLAPSFVRAFACMVVIGIGATAAWGRWRGRPIDAWVADISLFFIKTHRVAWRAHEAPRSTVPSIRPTSTAAAPRITEVVVAGRAPNAGASTLAAELAACLANRIDKEQWSVSLAPLGYDHRPSAASVLVSVAVVDGGRVCYLDRGAGPFVAAVIPDDDSVSQAAALGQPTVTAFPDARASGAFKELAEVIAAGDT